MAVIWPFQPSTEVESWGFLTEVSSSRTKEFRRIRRESAKLSVEATYNLGEVDGGIAEAIAIYTQKFKDQEVILPRYQQEIKTPANIGVGTFNITIPLAFRVYDWFLGDVVARKPNGDTLLVTLQNSEDFLPGRLPAIPDTLEFITTEALPEGTTLQPAIRGFLREGVGFDREGFESFNLSIKVESFRDYRLIDPRPLPMLVGKDIRRPTQTGNLSASILVPESYEDNGTGSVLRVSTSTKLEGRRSMAFQVSTSIDKRELLLNLHSLYGKATPIILPSFNETFFPRDLPIGPNDLVFTTTLVGEYLVGLVDEYIVAETPNGLIQRRIASIDSSGTVILDTPFDNIINPEDPIYLATYCRLDTDLLEFTLVGPGQYRVELSLKDLDREPVPPPVTDPDVFASLFAVNTFFSSDLYAGPLDGTLLSFEGFGKLEDNYGGPVDVSLFGFSVFGKLDGDPAEGPSEATVFGVEVFQKEVTP